MVIAFLHKDFAFYLLQLRDFKPTILFPGHWGAFGGAIEGDETPKDAAHRELEEEIGYSPTELHFFRTFYSEERNLLTYIFYAPLDVSLSQLHLTEGMDIGIFSTDEILSGQLRSDYQNQSFPVAPPLIEYMNSFTDFIAKKAE